MSFKKSFNLKNWQEPLFKELNFGRHGRVAIVDRQVVIRRTQPERLSILRATDQLADQGYIIPTGEINTKKQANNLLESLGCCISEKGRDFSLIEEQTNKEPLANPNIVDDGALKKEKNKQIKITDKFKNTNDPIFQMDDPPPRKDQLRDEKNRTANRDKRTVRLAAALVAYNSISIYAPTPLKYFPPSQRISLPMGGMGAPDLG